MVLQSYLLPKSVVIGETKKMGAGYDTSNFKNHIAVCRQHESEQKRANTSQRDLKLMFLQSSWLGNQRDHPGSLES